MRRLRHAGPIGDILLAMPSGVAGRTVGGHARGKGLAANDLVRAGKLGATQDPPRNPVAALSRRLSDGVINPAFGSLLLLSAIGMLGVARQRVRRRQRF